MQGGTTYSTAYRQRRRRWAATTSAGAPSRAPAARTAGTYRILRVFIFYDESIGGRLMPHAMRACARMLCFSLQVRVEERRGHGAARPRDVPVRRELQLQPVHVRAPGDAFRPGEQERRLFMRRALQLQPVHLWLDLMRPKYTCAMHGLDWSKLLIKAGNKGLAYIKSMFYFLRITQAW